MDEHRRFWAAIGVLIMLLGVVLSAMVWMPSLWAWIDLQYWIPLAAAVFSVLLGLVAILFGLPRLTIPSVMLGGTAYIMYWQLSTGYAHGWSYQWTLVLGLAGVGLLVSGLFGLQTQEMRSGAALIVVSVVLYSVFGTWLGGLSLLSPQWVFTLLLLVFILLMRTMLHGVR